MFKWNMYDLYHKNGECSPAQACQWTNVSSDIKFQVSIIPVPYVEQTLHRNSCKILQDCRTDHSHKKDKQDVISDRNRHNQDNHCSGTIERKHRTMHKSAVHPAVLSDRNITAFPYPSQKTVKKKE